MLTLYCHAHRDRREAVASGVRTRRGYCRGCWPETALLPVGALTPMENAFWPERPPLLDDAALFLAC